MLAKKALLGLFCIVWVIHACSSASTGVARKRSAEFSTLEMLFGIQPETQQERVNSANKREPEASQNLDGTKPSDGDRSAEQVNENLTNNRDEQQSASDFETGDRHAPSQSFKAERLFEGRTSDSLVGEEIGETDVEEEDRQMTDSAYAGSKRAPPRESERQYEKRGPPGPPGTGFGKNDNFYHKRGKADDNDGKRASGSIVVEDGESRRASPGESESRNEIRGPPGHGKRAPGTPGKIDDKYAKKSPQRQMNEDELDKRAPGPPGKIDDKYAKKSPQRLMNEDELDKRAPGPPGKIDDKYAKKSPQQQMNADELDKRAPGPLAVNIENAYDKRGPPGPITKVEDDFDKRAPQPPMPILIEDNDEKRGPVGPITRVEDELDKRAPRPTPSLIEDDYEKRGPQPQQGKIDDHEKRAPQPQQGKIEDDYGKRAPQPQQGKIDDDYDEWAARLGKSLPQRPDFCNVAPEVCEVLEVSQNESADYTDSLEVETWSKENRLAGTKRSVKDAVRQVHCVD